MTALDRFLESLRPRLEAEPQSRVILVTGNESADLDSFISALATAFFLTYHFAATSPPGSPTPIVLPFVNIPRADLALRSDVEFVFSMTNLSSDLLFFRDDLPRLTQIPSPQLSLFLVDHNKVADSMNMFPSAKVVGIIDHHKDEDLYRDTANPRRIAVVGSCSTLVADEFLAMAVHQPDVSSGKTNGTRPDWTQQVSRLLLGPILIDTQDLNPARKKVTPLDQTVAKKLLPYSGWSGYGDLYHRIDDARKDTSRLSAYDLLRKDYKEWVVYRATGEKVKVGISSVVGLLSKYIARDGQEVVETAVEQWAQNRTLDLSMVLFSEDLGEKHGGYQRQILVNPVTASVSGFTEELEAVHEIGLQPIMEVDTEKLGLQRITVADTEKLNARGGKAYQQWNTTMSRKQVWPLVERILTKAPDSNL
ncbi:Exopolyphosphatase [Podila horticola]|nr:Exopolyphosphatase [Podila horticola]